MSASARFQRATLKDFREAVRQELVALKPRFSYFSAVEPFNEEDLRDYIEDPVSALPPAVATPRSTANGPGAIGTAPPTAAKPLPRSANAVSDPP